MARVIDDPTLPGETLDQTYSGREAHGKDDGVKTGAASGGRGPRDGLAVRPDAAFVSEAGDGSMSLETLAWLSMAAYAIHVLEEYMFDWRNWARAVIKLPVEWSDFYVTNAVVVALGIAQAMLAPTLPLAPLVYASLMLVNAVFFHVLPMLFGSGRFSPGVATAVTLFLPLGVAVWRRAAEGGLLSASTAVLAVSGGVLLMAYPVVMLNLKSRPYFRQDRA